MALPSPYLPLPPLRSLSLFPPLPFPLFLLSTLLPSSTLPSLPSPSPQLPHPLSLPLPPRESQSRNPTPPNLPRVRRIKLESILSSSWDLPEDVFCVLGSVIMLLELLVFISASSMNNWRGQESECEREEKGIYDKVRGRYTKEYASPFSFYLFYYNHYYHFFIDSHRSLVLFRRIYNDYLICI